MRDESALGGSQNATANNMPVSLVALLIPNNPFYMSDVDIDLYVNVTTGDVQHLPGTGFVKCSPYPGLSVPKIKMSDGSILDNLSFTVSNENKAWFGVVAAGVYRNAQAMVWQAQINAGDGTVVESFSVSSGISLYAGRIAGNITANRKTATINLVPHVVPFLAQIPWRIHDSETFRRMPKSGKILRWGVTETKL